MKDLIKAFRKVSEVDLRGDEKTDGDMLVLWGESDPQVVAFTKIEGQTLSDTDRMKILRRETFFTSQRRSVAAKAASWGVEPSKVQLIEEMSCWATKLFSPMVSVEPVHLQLKNLGQVPTYLMQGRNINLYDSIPELEGWIHRAQAGYYKGRDIKRVRRHLARLFREQSRALGLVDLAHGSKKPEGGLAQVRWGNMKIKKNLSLNARSRTKPSSVNPSWYGRNVSDPGRWLIDKKVFDMSLGETGKRVAILVDASGSMSWDTEQLLRIIDELPSSTMAMYCGSGYSGDLTIISQNGRRIHRDTLTRIISHRPNGNIIDGPALEWLYKQPADCRIWLSDGGATAVNDDGDTNAETVAAEFCEKVGITRIDAHDIKEFNAEFEGLERK